LERKRGKKKEKKKEEKGLLFSSEGKIKINANPEYLEYSSSN